MDNIDQPSRSPAQRVFDQICPPVPVDIAIDLDEYAAPPSKEEILRERKIKEARRSQNQRCRKWWNHR